MVFNSKKDKIVESVLGEKLEPTANLTYLAGFASPSPRKGFLRLFTTLDFSECVDIPEDSIVARETMNTNTLPSASYVWFDKSASLTFCVVSDSDGDEEAGFFEGELTASKLANRASHSQVSAGLFSTPVCSVVVSLATVSMLACTRVKCKDPKPVNTINECRPTVSGCQVATLTC